VDNSKAPSCCGGKGKEAEHPDHTRELHRINRIAGQIEGIRRMVAGREYCPEIITQIQATRAALKALAAVILDKHLEMCVREALSSNDEREAKTKIDELVELFRKG